MLTLYFHPTDDSEAVELTFEHSLVSLSKWEAFYEKPFYSKESQTEEETKKYLLFMLLPENLPIDFSSWITAKHVEVVQEYINSKQTATTFTEVPDGRPSTETITNEVIYSWLVTFGIPFHPVETWHLNRLMTIVKIMGIKSTKPKKMTRSQQAEKYRKLNEQRRKDLGTTG